MESEEKTQSRKMEWKVERKSDYYNKEIKWKERDSRVRRERVSRGKEEQKDGLTKQQHIRKEKQRE